MEGMNGAARKALHELIDNLPESRDARGAAVSRVLRDQGCDPYAHLGGDPFAEMPEAERERLSAALEESEKEFEAGRGIPADEVLRELRASR